MATIVLTVDGDASGAVAAASATVSAISAASSAASAAGGSFSAVGGAADNGSNGLGKLVVASERAGSGLRETAAAAAVIGPSMAEAAGASDRTASALTAVASAALVGAATGGPLGAAFSGATAGLASLLGEASKSNVLNKAASDLANLNKTALESPASFGEGTAAIVDMFTRAGGAGGSLSSLTAGVRAANQEAAGGRDSYGSLTTAIEHYNQAQSASGGILGQAAASQSAAREVVSAYGAAMADAARASEGLAASQQSALSAINGTGDAFQNVWGNIMRAADALGSYSAATSNLTQAVVPGNWGQTEARASGGPVSAGRPYIVGENGPELFMPSSSGAIAPAGSFDTGGGGGSTVLNFSPVVNIGTVYGTEDLKRQVLDFVREASLHGLLRDYVEVH